MKLLVGEALGVRTTVTPNYVMISQNPAKYLDIDVFLPPRSELDSDFIWVKPFGMPLKQILAWVRHLYKRQCDLDDGKDIVVFEFYKVNPAEVETERPARLKPALSLEEYVDELEVNVSMYERHPWPLQIKPGRSADGSDEGRPYVPGEEKDEEEYPDSEEEREVGPAVSKSLIFEDGSPGLVPAVMADRLKFLESLTPSPAFKRILLWLRSNKVRM